jgi:hypothetical protein
MTVAIACLLNTEQVACASTMFLAMPPSILTGAYEPPKAVKERVTLVPLKYKSTRGNGRGNTCMSMGMGISNRRAVSKYGKFFA